MTTIDVRADDFGWLCLRRVVVAPPALDNDLSFSQGAEDLSVQQLVAKTSIKAFDVSILPRTALLDVGGLCADRGDPFLQRFGDELRSVVGSDVARNASKDKEIGQHIDHIDSL